MTGRVGLLPSDHSTNAISLVLASTLSTKPNHNHQYRNGNRWNPKTWYQRDNKDLDVEMLAVEMMIYRMYQLIAAVIAMMLYQKRQLMSAIPNRRMRNWHLIVKCIMTPIESVATNISDHIQRLAAPRKGAKQIRIVQASTSNVRRHANLAVMSVLATQVNATISTERREAQF